jgi:hypothetical protein
MTPSLEPSTDKLPPFLFERRILIKEQSFCFRISVERPFEPRNCGFAKGTALLLPERARVALVNSALEYGKRCWKFLVITFGLCRVRDMKSKLGMRLYVCLTHIQKRIDNGVTYILRRHVKRSTME